MKIRNKLNSLNNLLTLGGFICYMIIGSIVISLVVWGVRTYQGNMKNWISAVLPVLSIIFGAAAGLYATSVYVRIRSIEEKSKIVPKFLLKLTALVVPKQDRENMFGDLEENFPKLVKRVGRRVAILTYLKDIVSIPLLTLSRLIAKLGIAAGLWEFIKRKLL